MCARLAALVIQQPGAVQRWKLWSSACGRIVVGYPAKSYPEPQTRYNTLSLSKMDSVPFSKVDRAAA